MRFPRRTLSEAALQLSGTAQRSAGASPATGASSDPLDAVNANSAICELYREISNVFGMLLMKEEARQSERFR